MSAAPWSNEELLEAIRRSRTKRGPRPEAPDLLELDLGVAVAGLEALAGQLGLLRLRLAERLAPRQR